MYMHYEKSETREARLERLRRSILWAHEEGSFLDCLRWRMTYMAALAE